MAVNPIHHACMNHIDNDYHFVRDRVLDLFISCTIRRHYGPGCGYFYQGPDLYSFFHLKIQSSHLHCVTKDGSLAIIV